MEPHFVTQTGPGLESGLTGTFQASLTRAMVPFREPARIPAGGRLQDIGLGVVVDGVDPVRGAVVDLGSAEIRTVDLTGPLVVLGWLYPSGLRGLERAIDHAGPDGLERLRRSTFAMAIGALRGAGFGGLTRPTFLRIGFRDLCQDLDLHEDTAVRLLLPGRGVVRFNLDYDSATLIARTGRSGPAGELESALSQAFPDGRILREPSRGGADSYGYRIPLPVPRSLPETRELLGWLRAGLTKLLSRFEPDRHRSLHELSGTFGHRDSLRSLEEPDERVLEEVDRWRSSGLSGRRDVH